MRAPEDRGTRGRPAAFELVVAPVLLALVSSVAPNARAQEPLSVTVIGSPRDSRVRAVEEAVAYWNRELERLGAGVRLGPVRVVNDAVTDRVLRELDRGGLEI